MKLSRESILWIFFLAICFWAGYLKGYLPLSLQPKIFEKEPIRLLNAMPFPLSAGFTQALSLEMGREVSVEPVKSWEDLQVKLVVHNGAHILLAPAHWASTLERQGLIVGLSLLQPKIEKYVSPDFLSQRNRGSLQILPLYWTLTDFVATENGFPENNLQQILSEKELRKIHLYPDADLMLQHLRSDSPISAFLKSPGKSMELFDLHAIPSSIAKNEVWELPHLLAVPGTRVLASPGERALLVYGAMIPKNSANRRVSYAVLEKLLEPALEEEILSQWPLASTLKVDSNAMKIRKEQSPSEIRDLNLHELILLDKKNVEGLRELRERWNMRF